MHLPIERFDTAVAATLLVFVLALGGEGIVPWLAGRLRRGTTPRSEPARPSVPAAPAPAEPILRAAGLRKAFGGVVAVDDLSLELARGETIALIGPNGSGKTTALRLISGASVADAGAIELTGSDVTDVSTADRVRLGIARTLQTTSAFRS